jgi:hypothetical protein
MQKRYKPKIDRLFWLITLPTALLLLGFTVVPAIFEPITLLFTLPIDLFSAHFLVSPLFGYVELCEEDVFIKYGIFMKKIIPYSKIRSVEKGRRWYSESMMNLKLALDHVIIKFNTFDFTTVSVKDNDELILDLKDRCAKQ